VLYLLPQVFSFTQDSALVMFRDIGHSECSDSASLGDYLSKPNVVCRLANRLLLFLFTATFLAWVGEGHAQNARPSQHMADSLADRFEKSDRLNCGQTADGPYVLSPHILFDR